MLWAKEKKNMGPETNEAERFKKKTLVMEEHYYISPNFGFSIMST